MNIQSLIVDNRLIKVVLAAAVTLLLSLIISTTSHAVAEPAALFKPIIVGMGDSVAAGYGAGPFATSPYAAPCERTVAAYPTLLAASAPGYFKSYNLACTGATAAAGLNAAQTRNGVTVPLQISQLKALPMRPTLVTLTVGANDIHWVDFLAQCLQPNTAEQPGCDTPQNTAIFTQLLTAARPQIRQAVNAIQARNPQGVVVTGYYDPFGDTAPLFGLSTGEITWYRERLAQLNTVLKQVAKFQNATYVSTSSLNAAAGDVILSSDPLNTYGFAHPSPQGQAKIAQLVYDQFFSPVVAVR